MFLTIDFSTFQDILKINNLSAVVLIEKDIQIIEISINELKDDVSNQEYCNVSNIPSDISLLKGEACIIYIDY